MCALDSSSVNALPLKAEPIVLWSKSTDLYSFLCELYDDNGEIVNEAGVRTPVNSRVYGETLFDRGISSFHSIGAEFQTLAECNQAEPSPFGDPIQIDTPPNFLEDASFGLMAKHAIAWAAATEALLSDSQFFSLPHILEAEEELNCSVLLAKNLYYKQALQVLRGLLELNVLHVYFAGDPVAYAGWQKAQSRRWNVRGSGGLLETMQNKGTLTADISKAVDDLYKELNSTIHNAESKMLHRGLRERRWAGLQFKTEDFREWCAYVSRVVTVSVPLLAAMLQEVQGQPPAKGIVCNVCRAVNEFAVEDRSSSSVTLRCHRCGCQANFATDYAAGFGFS
jgi:hypothetical protein